MLQLHFQVSRVCFVGIKAIFKIFLSPSATGMLSQTCILYKIPSDVPLSYVFFPDKNHLFIDFQ